MVWYAGTPCTSTLVHCGLLPLSFTITVHTVLAGSSSDEYKSVWSESSCPLSFELLLFADTCLVALRVCLKSLGPPIDVARDLHSRARWPGLWHTKHFFGATCWGLVLPALATVDTKVLLAIAWVSYFQWASSSIEEV